MLSTDLMNEWRKVSGYDAEHLIPLSFKYWAYGPGALNEQRKKELVVLTEVLPDAINVGYHRHMFEIITTVNGKEFESFQEFVTLVDTNTEEYIIFENEHKQQLIMSSEDAERATEGILARNHISSWHSEDVSLWLKH